MNRKASVGPRPPSHRTIGLYTCIGNSSVPPLRRGGRGGDDARFGHRERFPANGSYEATQPGQKPLEKPCTGLRETTPPAPPSQG